MKKKQLIWIGIVTILIAILLAFGLNVLFKVHTDGIFSAEWEAGDALNYVASIFGAVGTIILGYVAYKQNDRLQEMENNNYIANYSSMILMDTIYIKQQADIPVNWDIHSEQIIKDKAWNENVSYVGYKFTFNGTSIGNSIPVLIHIKNCNIFCSDDSNKNMSSHLFGKNYSNVYSRIAIHQDGKIKFGLTYVIDAKKRGEFEDAIKQSAYKVIIEIVFDIVTDKGVVTQCKCISNCDGKKCANLIIWEDKDPKVFFYGHNIANINELKIAGEEENHG